MRLLFRIAIYLPFRSAHGASRNHPHSRSSRGEDDRQVPPAIGARERQKPRLDLRVPDVGSQHDWPIEQGLLGLTLANLMMVPILLGVARVPLELLEPGKELI